MGGKRSENGSSCGNDVSCLQDRSHGESAPDLSFHLLEPDRTQFALRMVLSPVSSPDHPNAITDREAPLHKLDEREAAKRRWVFWELLSDNAWQVMSCAQSWKRAFHLKLALSRA